MTKKGQAELKEEFAYSSTDVFQMLFGDEMFVKFHSVEKREDVEITQTWRRIPKVKTQQYEREGKYIYGESRVLKQGSSTVSVREVAEKDVDGIWSIKSSFRNCGGPLATSTIVDALYVITPSKLNNSHCTATCTIEYSYDLSSVSWMLRPAVDMVVSSEMKGIPRRMFSFAASNPCTGNAADVILYIDSSSGSVNQVADNCATDPTVSEIQTPPAAPEPESEHVAVSVSHSAGSPSSRRLSVSIKSPRSRCSEELLNNPVATQRTFSSISSSVSKRRGKSLFLITVIFVFWMSAAMVGSSG